MKIILDTNPIYQDFFLSRHQIKILERHLSTTEDELCIPGIVREEIVRHFQKKYKEILDAQKKVNEFLGSIGHIRNATETTPSLEEATKEYQEKLHERLKALNARIMPLPKIGLEKILQRDLGERKPFDTSGKGFRDTLIWETILEECQKHGEEIILISADFGSPIDDNQTYSLFPDLLADLEKENLPKDRVKLCKDLKQFNSLFTSPPTNRVYREGEPTNGTIVEKLDPKEILKRYENYALGEIYDILPDFLRIETAFVSKISFVRWSDDVRLIEAFDLGDKTIQATIHAFAGIDADVNFDANSYLQLFTLPIFKDIILLETEWDRKLGFHAKLRLHIFVDLSCIIDATTLNLINMELLQIRFQ